MKHLINWIEIPVTNMKRASRFYSNILGEELQEMETAGNTYALFPSKDQFNSGALVQGDAYKPSAEGVQIYLDGGKDLSKVLNKVKSEGGQVILEKTFLSPEAGYIGLFVDSEGNKIGLQHL